ncbi:hypothetical protein [Paraglaciecola chathamensis]|uniref:CHRD domain-containing protein n=1 Tax=Paraglaciecola chathamensis S18K6 TaxID=1127672 RepID=A0AAV3UTB6_9ALTE|nr:hypothetical protein [Paraglaciecola chathamensis]GAC08327.1 hypothetical protein GCHA_0363 [Paraglaciecola chathamensis S18K6]
MRKHYLLLLSALLTTPLVINQAMAHGNTEPVHGGVVKIVGEYSFEMKAQGKEVSVWVFYDGEPLNASDLQLRLKVKGKGRKEVVTIPAREANEFTGPLDLAGIEQVLAMLTLEDGVSKIVGKYKL